ELAAPGNGGIPTSRSGQLSVCCVASADLVERRARRGIMLSSRFALALVLGATTVIGAAALSARVGPSAAAQSGPGLEGSWMSEGTAATGGPFPLGGLRFTTYNADGTLVTTSRGRGEIPTTGHGSWMRVGDREFATTWFGFGRDAEGNYTTIAQVRGR